MRNDSIYDSEILYHLFLSEAKDEGGAKLLESVLNQILQAKAKDQIKAEPYERTEERQDCRNGYYPRNLVTRAGTLTLRCPDLEKEVIKKSQEKVVKIR